MADSCNSLMALFGNSFLVYFTCMMHAYNKNPKQILIYYKNKVLRSSSFWVTNFLPSHVAHIIKEEYNAQPLSSANKGNYQLLVGWIKSNAWAKCGPLAICLTPLS